MKISVPLHLKSRFMHSTVRVHDKAFELLISAESLQNRVKELAAEVENTVKADNPLFLCVLNGAVYFTADLTRHFNYLYEMSCIKLASYQGMKSGVMKELAGLSEDISNRHVVILEDIVDTGNTLIYLMNYLKAKGAAKVTVVALLLKPEALKHKVKPDFTGFEVPNHFLVGYGLDYNKLGRNLPGVYQLKS